MVVLDSKNDELSVLLEKLTRAVSFKYSGSSAPSVIVSALPNGKYYASIVKYSGGSKQVMHNTTADGITQAVEKLTDIFMGVHSPPNDPVEELKQHLHTKNEARLEQLKLKFEPSISDGYMHFGHDSVYMSRGI